MRRSMPRAPSTQIAGVVLGFDPAFPDGAVAGMVLVDSAGHARRIVAYDAQTRVASVSPDFDGAPVFPVHVVDPNTMTHDGFAASFAAAFAERDMPGFGNVDNFFVRSFSHQYAGLAQEVAASLKRLELHTASGADLDRWMDLTRAQPAIAPGPVVDPV